MITDKTKRVVIEHVSPEIDHGRFPIKRVAGEQVIVEADIFADGHDEISAVLLYRAAGSASWSEAPMTALGNDRWRGSFTVQETGIYRYTVQGWVDHYRTWLTGLRKKMAAGQDIRLDLQVGAEHMLQAAERAGAAHKKRLQQLAAEIRSSHDSEQAVSLARSDAAQELMTINVDKTCASTYEPELTVIVDRRKALYSSWYELFPRSYGQDPGRHGSFKDCEMLLPEIARMGFDVVYLPPIHPIGETNRKGRNNASVAGPDDPGSPWAIGSEDGGHTSVNPLLGSMQDFEHFVSTARTHDIEVALDIAFQCSLDHPYIKQHPEWFRWLPDGTIQYAENPPKKYEDVVPFNFETENCRELWDELKSVVCFWIAKGVKIFRVDNPHTKPFAFWAWLIGEVKQEHPDVLFLAEAFTRPKVMYRLAKAGFTQSYTYFTWRNTKRELTDYLTELTTSEVKEYFRPHFWPNTPDILPEYLQYGGRPGFIIRLVLAATLSSNYGIYGAAYELLEDRALNGKEEYLDSEKYELRVWDTRLPGNLRDLIARINRIRRDNPALQATANITFYETDNDYLLFYGKSSADLANICLTVVNLDPFHAQSGTIRIPLEELGIVPGQPYLLQDLLGGEKYIWQGEWNHISLNPQVMPAQIFLVRRRMRREHDFDYFM